MAISIATRGDHEDVGLIHSFLCFYPKSCILRIHLRNSFSIMNCYFPFIEKKNFFKYSYDISSIIRYRKNSVICFTLQWNTMGLEPFSTFFWRKFPKCRFYKFGSTGISREEFFFIRDPSCYITSSTSRDNHFFSWCQIFFENMNMVIIVLVIFENGYGGHKSRGSCADDGYGFHRKSI